MKECDKREAVFALKRQRGKKYNIHILAKFLLTFL